MSKIKVLHIIKSLGRGGAEMLLLETLKKHDKSKFEFYYIYFLPWKNELVNSLEEQGATVINLKANNNLFIICRIVDIVKIIKNYKIDIIHCHLPWAGIAGRLAGLFSKISIVYTEHNKQERYHSITKWLNKVTYSMQDIVLAVSTDVKDSILKYIKSNIEIRVIFNGVDTVYLENKRWDIIEFKNSLNIKGNEIIIGNVCVFRKQKRLIEWVELFEQINLKHPQTKGLIVGAGILFDEVKAYIKNKGMNEKIILVGLQIDVRQYLNIIDIFLSTSEFEGMPIALLEAMSMECAIVTTKAGGIGDIIIDGINGYCADINNVQALVAPLNELITNDSLRNQVSQHARNTVIDKFSINRTTINIEDCYNNLLNIN